MQAKTFYTFQIGNVISIEDFKNMSKDRLKMMNTPQLNMLNNICSSSFPLDTRALSNTTQGAEFNDLETQLKMLYFFNPVFCYKFLIEVAAYLLPTSVSVKRVEEEDADGKMQTKHYEVVEDKRIPLALEAAKRYIATGDDDHRHQMQELTNINHSGSEERPIGLYAGAMEILRKLDDGPYMADPARALFGVYMDEGYLNVDELRNWMENRLSQLIANISYNTQDMLSTGINRRGENLPQEVKDLKAEIGELNGTPYQVFRMSTRTEVLFPEADKLDDELATQLPVIKFDSNDPEKLREELEELFPEADKLDDELAAQLPVIKFDSNDPEKLREELEELKRIKAGDYENKPGHMDAAVYNFGRSFLIVADAENEHYDDFANILAKETGAKVDWHFSGGRAVFKCVDQNNEGTDEIYALVKENCERLLPQLQEHTGYINMV